MPTFDAEPGTSLAPVRPAVRDFRVLGWSSIGIGLAGLAAVLATSDHVSKDVIGAVALAAFFGAWMWFLVGRKQVRDALALPGELMPPVTIETAPFPVIAMQLPLALLIGVLLVVDFAAPPVGIALGAGLWQLTIAQALRRWERVHGRTLFATKRRYGIRLQRGQLFAR
jgi:hypothetical protein